MKISGSLPINIEAGNPIITLKGENSLIGAGGSPGLSVPLYTQVTIQGDGSLTAIGSSADGGDGAGIGGGYMSNHNAGKIIINSGTIYAEGGTSAAGIGGGARNSHSYTGGDHEGIEIHGGYVTASGGKKASSIGGGAGLQHNGGEGGNVTITGGTVELIGLSPDRAFAIGPGDSFGGVYGSSMGASASIRITGGNIKATAGKSGTLKDAPTNVSLVTILLKGHNENTVFQESNIEYGLKDVKVLDKNRLYLYLTEDQISSLNTLYANNNSEVYKGEIKNYAGNYVGVFVLEHACEYDELDICTICGSGKEPETNSEGAYLITNLSELLWFTDRVNSGYTSIDAKLMNDIDASDSRLEPNCLPYSGTFDGNKHTITIEFNGLTQYTALFGYVKGATIQNLTVDGTVTTNSQFASGLIGTNLSGAVTTVKNVISSVEINSTVNGDGTHGGIVAIAAGELVLENVGFAGSINGTATTSCGGLIGWVNGKTSVTITDCYQAGTFGVKKDAGHTIARNFNANNVTVNDFYYINALNATPESEEVIQASSKEFERGKVTYLLNDGVTDGTQVWYQTLGTDQFPVLRGAAVYEGAPCPTYSNTVFTAEVQHVFKENGVCENCGEYQEPEMEEDTYLIANIGNLNKFAELVNSGNASANAKVIADIDGSNEKLISIGTEGNPYAGVFDGMGHSITLDVRTDSAYGALFRYVKGTVIQNLIVDGEIQTSAKYASGLIGTSLSGAATNVKNVVSKVIIESTVNGDGTHGGLVGIAAGDLVLENVGFAGAVNGSATTSCGGFVGWVNDDVSVTISDSYLAASFGVKADSGHTIARNYDKDMLSVTNFYYLNALNTTPTSNEITQMSAEDFRSGKVTYLLNEGVTDESLVWGQNIDAPGEKEEYPVLNGLQVYKIKNCNNEDDYSNTNKDITEHSYDEDTGYCPRCGDVLNNLYQIHTIEHLVEFASFVNKGNKTLNAVLMNDLDMKDVAWTPIGQTDSYHNNGAAVTDSGYAGTFDGNGHVISNLSVTGGSTGTKSYGLFGTLSGTVRQLGLDNYTFHVGSADCRAGGVAGQVVTDGLITDCYITNSKVLTDSRIAGGIAGCNYGGTIQNCYAYDVEVTGYSTRFGAIVGDSQDDGGKKAGFIDHCYSNGIRIVSTQSTAENITNCEVVTSEEFVDGFVTYALNGKKDTPVEELIWFQTLGTDTVPKFTGEIVYFDSENGTYYNILHDHEWTYTPGNLANSITAVCADPEACDIDTVTVTLSAPSTPVFDNTAKSASVTVSAEDMFTNLESQIVYAGNNLVDGKPVNAGTYTASLTLGTATATVEYTIEKALIESVMVGVTAPKAGETAQTAVDAGDYYTGEISWSPEAEMFGYNTVYTATVVLTPEENHRFSADTAAEDFDVTYDDGSGELSLRKTFDATRKAKITSVTAPSDVELEEHYADAEKIMEILPQTVEIEAEDGTALLSLTWSVEGTYDTAPKAVNTFQWTAEAGGLDVNNQVVEGTVKVTNAAALPVEIESEASAEVPYDGNPIDLTKLFVVDENAGEATYTVTPGTGAGTAAGTELTVTKAGTFTVQVDTAANGIYAAGTATVELTVNKGTQSTPNGLTAVDESIDNINDGKITGADSTMEYCTAGEDGYIAVTGTVITGLADGTYYVRYAETDVYEASADTEVVISAGRKLTVTVPETQTGYTLTVSTDELSYGGIVTLTFELAEGYSKDIDFAVKVNDIVEELNADHQITIENVQEDLVVTVEGVADLTGPVIEKTEVTDVTDSSATITIVAADELGEVVGYELIDIAGLHFESSVVIRQVSAGVFEITNLTPTTSYRFGYEVTDNAGNVTRNSGDFLSNTIEFTTSKLIPRFDGEPTVTGVYGTAVKDLTITGPKSTNGAEGTWTLLDPSDVILEVGNTVSYKLLFTPTDTETYSEVEVDVVPVIIPDTTLIDSLNKDTLEPSDKDELEQLIKELEEVIESPNVTPEQKEELEKEKEEAEILLEQAMSSVIRLYGKTRYETALKVADAFKVQLNVDKFDTVIIASGQKFADALSGSYLASQKNAPILMTNGKNIDALKEYISENLASDGMIYILGGEAAVSEEVEDTFAGYAVKRLAGENRIETNLEILKEIGVTGNELIVCTSKNFADSLSASASDRPILLAGGTLTDAQREFLSANSGKRLYVIGGTGAVSAEIAEQLESYGTVERIGGATRYETSVMVAKKFFADPDFLVLAYAKNFPDGLCGGVLAAKMNAPIILTESSKETNDDAAIAYGEEYDLGGGAVLGGPGLISDETVRGIYQMSADDTIIIK